MPTSVFKVLRDWRGTSEHGPTSIRMSRRKASIAAAHQIAVACLVMGPLSAWRCSTSSELLASAVSASVSALPGILAMAGCGGIVFDAAAVASCGVRSAVLLLFGTGRWAIPPPMLSAILSGLEVGWEVFPALQLQFEAPVMLLLNGIHTCCWLVLYLHLGLSPVMVLARTTLMFTGLMATWSVLEFITRARYNQAQANLASQVATSQGHKERGASLDQPQLDTQGKGSDRSSRVDTAHGGLSSVGRLTGNGNERNGHSVQEPSLPVDLGTAAGSNRHRSAAAVQEDKASSAEDMFQYTGLQMRKVSIKIESASLLPDHLPHDVVQRLNLLFAGACTGSGMGAHAAVVSAAVRPGCIRMQLDVGVIPVPATPTLSQPPRVQPAAARTPASTAPRTTGAGAASYEAAALDESESQGRNPEAMLAEITAVNLLNNMQLDQNALNPGDRVVVQVEEFVCVATWVFDSELGGRWYTQSSKLPSDDQSRPALVSLHPTMLDILPEPSSRKPLPATVSLKLVISHMQGLVIKGYDAAGLIGPNGRPMHQEGGPRDSDMVLGALNGRHSAPHTPAAQQLCQLLVSHNGEYLQTTAFIHSIAHACDGQPALGAASAGLSGAANQEDVPFDTLDQELEDVVHLSSFNSSQAPAPQPRTGRLQSTVVLQVSMPRTLATITTAHRMGTLGLEIWHRGVLVASAACLLLPERPKPQATDPLDILDGIVDSIAEVEVPELPASEHLGSAVTVDRLSHATKQDFVRDLGLWMDVIDAAEAGLVEAEKSNAGGSSGTAAQAPAKLQQALMAASQHMRFKGSTQQENSDLQRSSSPARASTSAPASGEPRQVDSVRNPLEGPLTWSHEGAGATHANSNSHWGNAGNALSSSLEGDRVLQHRMAQLGWPLLLHAVQHSMWCVALHIVAAMDSRAGRLLMALPCQGSAAEKGAPLSDGQLRQLADLCSDAGVRAQEDTQARAELMSKVTAWQQAAVIAAADAAVEEIKVEQPVACSLSEERDEKGHDHSSHRASSQHTDDAQPHVQQLSLPLEAAADDDIAASGDLTATGDLGFSGDLTADEPAAGAVQPLLDSAHQLSVAPAAHIPAPVQPHPTSTDACQLYSLLLQAGAVLAPVASYLMLWTFSNGRASHGGGRGPEVTRPTHPAMLITWALVVAGVAIAVWGLRAVLARQARGSIGQATARTLPQDIGLQATRLQVDSQPLVAASRTPSLDRTAASSPHAAATSAAVSDACAVGPPSPTGSHDFSRSSAAAEESLQEHVSPPAAMHQEVAAAAGAAEHSHPHSPSLPCATRPVAGHTPPAINKEGAAQRRQVGPAVALVQWMGQEAAQEARECVDVPSRSLMNRSRSESQVGSLSYVSSAHVLWDELDALLVNTGMPVSIRADASNSQPHQLLEHYASLSANCTPAVSGDQSVACDSVLGQKGVEAPGDGGVTTCDDIGGALSSSKQ